MIPLILATCSLQSPVSVEILSIERSETTVGRRGKRIREAWTISIEKAEANVFFYPYHTNIANTPKKQRVGQTVNLELSLSDLNNLKSDGKIWLAIEAIR